jgi:hemolysin activation/secretion protein
VRLIFGLSVALALAHPTIVFAQPAPDDVVREAQHVQDRENQRQAEREEKLRSGQETPPSGQEPALLEAPSSDDGHCAAIREVSLKGLTRYSEKEFSDALSGLIGSCVNIDAINTALRAITNRYVADGYVTSRAVVGPQDLKTGTLEIVVVEGAIAEIRSSEKGYSDRTLNMAFAGQKGNLLNLRAIEQGVDQLARLASFEPGIDIEPGALPGTSNLVISRKEIVRNLRPTLSFDNDGSASTGRFQSMFGLDADNVLSLADYWSLYYTRGLKNKAEISNESMGGFVSLPYGWWTASLSGGRFTYTSILSGNGQAFSNDGKSWNAALLLDRMLYRDAKTKFTLSWGVNLTDTENRIQGIRLSTSSYRQVTGSVNLRFQRRLKDAFVGIDFGFARGLKILGANAADTGPGGATIQARRLSAAVTYQTKVEFFDTPLDYNVLLRAQAALDPVFSNGRFSLGGSSTVRGFRDDGISGRYGTFLRQEVGFPLAKLFTNDRALAIKMSGVVGYDAGAIIAYNSDRFERGQLHASTVGLRISSRHVQAELSASAPVLSPSFINRTPYEVSASVRITF